MHVSLFGWADGGRWAAAGQMLAGQAGAGRWAGGRGQMDRRRAVAVAGRWAGDGGPDGYCRYGVCWLRRLSSWLMAKPPAGSSKNFFLKD